MIEIIKIGVVGFICSKSLKVFGKKDYADVITFLMVLYVGVMVFSKITGWYESFIDTKFMELMVKIFCVDK